MENLEIVAISDSGMMVGPYDLKYSCLQIEIFCRTAVNESTLLRNTGYNTWCQKKT